MISIKEELAAEKRICEKLYSSYQKANVSEVQQKKRDFQMGKEIWEMLTTGSERFESQPNVVKISKEIEASSQRVSEIEHEINANGRTVQYVKEYVNSNISSIAHSNNRAGYFATLQCMDSYGSIDKNIENILTWLDHAKLPENANLPMYRKAQAYILWVKEHQEERVNNSIIRTRNQYCNSAKSILETLSKPTGFKQENKEMAKAAKKELKRLNAIKFPEPANGRTATGNGNSSGRSSSQGGVASKSFRTVILVGVIAMVALVLFGKINGAIANLENPTARQEEEANKPVSYNYDDNGKLNTITVREGGDVVICAQNDEHSHESLDSVRIETEDGVEVTSLTFEEGIQSIKELDLNDVRDSVTAISLPSSLEYIGDYVFQGMENLKDVTIASDQLRYVGYEVLQESKWYSRQMADGIVTLGNVLLSYDMTLDWFEIPEGITVLGAYSFKGCIYLSDIEIPEGIAYINEGAFDGVPLNSVTFPSTLKEIGGRAFAYTSLTAINFNDSCEAIGDEAFDNCGYEGGIVFPDNLERIGNKAFYNVYLSSMQFPDSLKYIGDSAFSTIWGTDVDELILPEGLEEIGENAFGSVKADTLVIPSTLIIIHKNSFNYYAYSNKEEEFVIKSGILITYNGEGGNVTIPEGVVLMNADAFDDCYNITSITFPSGMRSIPEDTFNGKGLSKVNLSDTIQYIGNSAFWYNPDLTYLVIPPSVKTIKSDAFNNCRNLNYVEGLENVVNLEENAFETSIMNDVE